MKLLAIDLPPRYISRNDPTKLRSFPVSDYPIYSDKPIEDLGETRKDFGGSVGHRSIAKMILRKRVERIYWRKEDEARMSLQIQGEKDVEKLTEASRQLCCGRWRVVVVFNPFAISQDAPD